MKPLEYFGVAAQQVTQHPIHVLKIEGQFLGATADRYLQVHDSTVVPAEGAVPLKQWLINQSSPFFQTFSAGELSLALGLYICVSTTDGTKTLSADTMDLGVELTDPEVPTGTTYVSDLATAANSFTIWADGAGPHKLLSLQIDGTGLGFDSWVMITAQALSGAPIILDQFHVPIGKTFLGLSAVTFGKDGRDLFAVDPSDGSSHNGCYLYVSKKQGVVTVSAGNNVKIKAEYK
jgi:hypothetical protein